MPSRRLLAVLLPIALGFGCSDTDQPVVSLDAEPAGANCPAGGQAIHTGIDRDGNGALDSNEVTSTRYVCNGAEGHDTLFAAVDEPAGASCPHGGKALRHGLDIDRDGLLDSEEVSGTEYVCNGAPGVVPDSLVNVMDEPAGTNCPAGGQAIRSGVDDDADGVLQPGEVDSTGYVCNGAVGQNSLVRQEDEIPGAHCLNGGRSVMTGLDADHDSFLDDSEVAATSFVCNGADGAPAHASLVLVETAAPGPACVAGGYRVRYGRDRNDDGTLDSNEVDSTFYVCNGGVAALRVTNAVWGGVCARGGVKVETGRDANADGVLEDAEVERTQYVCNLFVTKITSKLAHTCALISDGTARCWGGNERGQLGDGTRTDRHRPVTVNGLSSATALATGRSHTCALISDGSVRCWGWNVIGQLGDGTNTDSFTPVAVHGISSATALVAGGFYTCARISDGSVRCWGSNGRGELGDGTVGNNRYTPVMVSGLNSATALAAGWDHTCAVLSDGSVRCWGVNGDGQLGDGTTTNRPIPVEVSGLASATSLAVGLRHTCAGISSSSPRCWGSNERGQLGDGTLVHRLTPVSVSNMFPVSTLAAGDFHTCALTPGGLAYCWGADSFDENGIDWVGAYRTTPNAVNGVTSATSLAAGSGHTCVLISDGSVRCWGWNWVGQLGDGTITKRLTPTPISLGLSP